MENNELKIGYMEDALRAATNSHGLRGKVGIYAVTLDEEFSAWNDLPDDLPRTKCETEAPTIEESHTLPEVLHAEERLVCDCARMGESLYGAVVYITRTPCKKCAAHLVQAGIKRLYYFSEHPHGDGLPILEEAGIPVEKLNFKQDILEEKYL